MKSFISKLIKINTFKKDIYSGSISALINTLLVFFSYPIYLNYLGVELWGLWAAFAIFLVLAQMGQLGIQESIVRFVSEAVEFNDEGKSASQYVTASFFILVVTSFIVMLCYFLIDNYVFIWFNIDEEYIFISQKLLKWVFLLVPIIMFTQFFKGLIMALGKIAISNYVFAFSIILKFLLTIYFLSRGFLLSSIFYGWLFSSIFSLVIYIYIAVSNMRTLFLFDKMFYCRLKEIFNFGKYLLANSVLNISFIPFITFLITRYIGLAEVTFFDITWRIYNSFKLIFMRGIKGIIPYAAKNNLLSKNSSLYKKNINELFKRCSYFIAFLGIPLLLFLTIFSPQILFLWLADNFDPVLIFCIRCLLIALTLELFVLSIWNIFISIDKPQYNLYATTLKISTTGFLLLFFYLSDLFSLEYLCLSVSIGVFVLSLYLYLKYKYFLKLK